MNTDDKDKHLQASFLTYRRSSVFIGGQGPRFVFRFSVFEISHFRCQWLSFLSNSDSID